MTKPDKATVEGFGDEWTTYDQSELSANETQRIFDEYFHAFPWNRLPNDAIGFDFGCGSGRWAALVAPRVGTLHCIDASNRALDVARRNLAEYENVEFHHGGIESAPIADGTADFGYSLGVLHHIPDTEAALRQCASKLKPGSPFLVYIYYRFDNRPLWYRWLWEFSDALRLVIARLPFGVRLMVSRCIAAAVYWPLARIAGGGHNLGLRTTNWPLDYYRNKTFYVMKTDALDRFGTRLEKRFTKREVEEMLDATGLQTLVFNDTPPYWCVVTEKRSSYADQ